MTSTRVRLWVAIVCLAGLTAPPWSALAANSDVAVGAKKLLVRGGANPKVDYRVSDKLAGITKGAGTDLGAISVEFFFMRGDSDAQRLEIPPGAFADAEGWKKNDAKRASFRNNDAPAGSTTVRKTDINPGKKLQLTGRDALALDLDPGGSTEAYTAYCVSNDGETHCHCSHFKGCKTKAKNNGNTFQCKNGGPDPECRAANDAAVGLTASASGALDDVCLSQLGDVFDDVISSMIDQGFEVEVAEVEPPDLGPLEDDLFKPAGTQDLIPFFPGNGRRSSRFGGRDAMLVFTCTPSANQSWSMHGAVDVILEDAFDTEGLGRHASLGDGAVNASTVTTEQASAHSEPVFVVYSGDQATFDLLDTAISDAGLPYPVNLAPLADVTMSDGQGGSIGPFSTSAFPKPQLLMRHVQTVLPGRTSFEGRDFVSAGYVFRRPGLNVPVTPVAATIDPTSASHADLVKKSSKGFDQLVDRVIDAFEDEPFNLTLASDTPFLRQNGQESALGKDADVFEGGQTCLDDDLDCGFDDPDSHLSWDGDSHTLTDSDYWVVVGLDYAKLAGLGGPMAQASSLGLFVVEDPNDPSRTFEVAIEVATTAAVNNGGGVSTVESFVSDKLPKKAAVLSSSAFVYPITRPANCVGGFGGQHCVDTATLPEVPLALVSRLTLNPATGTRPDPSQVIPWRLLKFEVSP